MKSTVNDLDTLQLIYLKKVWAELFFLDFKFRGVSFEICLTIPCHLPVMFNFVRTVILDAFGTICIAYKSCVFLFPAILVLGNIKVYVHIPNCYNMATNVKASVD